jgi:hypothetical protein
MTMRKLQVVLLKYGFTLILIVGGATVLLSKTFSTALSALGVAGGTIAALALAHYGQMRDSGRRTRLHFLPLPGSGFFGIFKPILCAVFGNF